jgi:signal transduction histidine kinase
MGMVEFKGSPSDDRPEPAGIGDSGEFVQLVHELESALKAMSGCLPGLLGRLPGAGPDEDLTELTGALADARRIVTDLLREPRSPGDVREVIDVGKFVKDMQGSLNHLGGASVAVTFRSVATPALVLAQRVDLERIVLNLAMNAFEAIDGEGEIALEVGFLHFVDSRVDLFPTVQRCVRLTVADTGSGIDPAVIARAFDPFVSTKAHHSGLGLLRVASIVRTLGGRILIESRVGAGTRVQVCLPAV